MVPILTQQLLRLPQLRQAAELGRELLVGTQYENTKYEELPAILAIQRVAANPDGAVIGAYKGDELVAVIAVIAQPYFWVNQTTGDRFVSDLFFVSKHPGAGAMVLRKAINWAWKQPKVVECTFAVSSGVGRHETMSRFFERNGARMIGGMYMVRKPK